MYSWVSKTAFYLDAVIDHASPHFPVHVIDLEDPRGLTAAFLCDSMKANIACENQLGTKQNDVSNKGSLDAVRYEEISLAAARKGLIDINRWNRTQVAEAIKMYIDNDLHQTTANLPFTCPTSNDIDRFWQTSLQMHEKYAPESVKSDPTRLSKLRHDFDQKIESNAFCLVDTETLLNEESWLQFFSRFS